MRLQTAILTLLVLTGCDPFHTTFEEVEPADSYVAQRLVEHVPSERIEVMSWNIKFGGGRIEFFFSCFDDRVLMTDEETLDNMEAVASAVRTMDPDILLMQEIDVAAKRSAYVDQLQFLLDNTELNYAVYGSQWRADYVPSDGIGPVDSGNAILSKWPLRNGTRIALPLIDEQDGLTQYFYLRRNILVADVVLPDGDIVTAANVHTAAFSNDGTKKEQIDIFKEKLDEFDADGRLFIAGGDLNTLPPGSEKYEDFPDQVCEDNDFEARGDKLAELDWMVPLLETYEAAIPTAVFEQNNAPYFTFTSDKDGFWNRKLDYLFTNGRFENGLVHQSETRGGVETMPLSDHAPLSAELVR